MHPVGPCAAVEDDAFGKAAMIEIGLYSGLGEFVQNVLRAGPVLQTLKIVMETVTDILVPFTHRDPAVGLGQNYRADEARGPGSNNFNLVIAGGGMVGHRCHHPAAFRRPVPSCILESRVQPQDPPTGTMRQRTSLSTSLCDDARHPSSAEPCVNACGV